MTTSEHTETHADGCLMCAVRALTEGVPTTWQPETAGEQVSGVVLKTGTVATNFGPVLFVDLWIGGHERIRIMAYGARLRHVLDDAAALIGDTLTVWFDGEKTLTAGKWAGKTYKDYSANVQRGHGEASR